MPQAAHVNPGGRNMPGMPGVPVISALRAGGTEEGTLIWMLHVLHCHSGLGVPWKKSKRAGCIGSM